MRNYWSAIPMTMKVVHTGSYTFDSVVPSLSLCCWCSSCVSYLKDFRNHQLCSKSPSVHTEIRMMWNFLVQDKLAEDVFTSPEFSPITSERSILFPFPKRKSQKSVLKGIKTERVTILPFSPGCVQPGKHLWVFLFCLSNYYFHIPRQTSRRCMLHSVIIILSTTASATAN